MKPKTLLWLVAGLAFVVLWVMIVILFLLSGGCAHHGNGHSDPTPRPTAAPHPTIAPPAGSGKVTLSDTIRVDGKRAASLVLMDAIFNDAVYPLARQDEIIQKLKYGTLNLLDVDIVGHWSGQQGIGIWAKGADGKARTDQQNPVFWNKLRSLSVKAHQNGVALILDVFNGWCLRSARDGIWELNPRNHHEVGAPLLFDVLDYDANNPFCLSRRFWKCSYPNHDYTKPCGGCLDGCDSPTWKTIVRWTAELARERGDVIKLWSEMNSNPAIDNDGLSHEIWDRQARKEWTEKAIRIIRQVYPTAIVGTSVPGDSHMIYGAAGLQFADLHHIGKVGNVDPNCDPVNIPAAAGFLRTAHPGIIPMFNTDSCQGPNRIQPWYCKAVCLQSWQSGGVPALIIDRDIWQDAGIFEGVKQARQAMP